MTTWQSTDNYKYEFAETDDPRVLAVIQQDDSAQISEEFDGDAINPVIYVDHVNGLRFGWVAGYDGGEAALMQQAYDRWGWEGKARRWLWKKHGIAADNAFGGYDRSGNWIVATSHAFRDHIETPRYETYEEAREDCKSTARGVSDVLDGYVYGIGWAINEGRRLPSDEPIDLLDGSWDIDIDCWGFVGEEYAKTEALGLGIPTHLPAMLPIEVLA